MTIDHSRRGVAHDCPHLFNIACTLAFYVTILTINLVLMWTARGFTQYRLNSISTRRTKTYPIFRTFWMMGITVDKPHGF